MMRWIFRLVMCFLLIASSLQDRTAADDEAKLYIVYLGKNVHKTVEDTHAHHHQILSNVFDSKESALECLVYHYKHGFSGFSARLTPTQAAVLSQLPEVVSVFKSQVSELHTTRSWTYLGLDQTKGVWPDAKFGEDVIIGVFDTGIWPESLSFDGTGLSAPPTRWKGECSSDVDFDSSLACNNKLIGAKFFFDGYKSEHNDTESIIQSTRDYNGHGTHTASTIAGARVDNADFNGLAPGTAVGGAPSARIAVYKVCWTDSCDDSDVLAAFDQAISDGVDIISVSIGTRVHRPFYEDPRALGGYHALAQGILVVHSAGNDGPDLGTVTSTAPWLLTVGASTIDREYVSDVVLGDGTTIEGLTINLHTNFTEEERELIDAGAIPADGSTSELSKFCIPNSLNAFAAQDKVVVCQQAPNYTRSDGNVVRYAVDRAVAEASGYGIIVVNDNFTTEVSQFDNRYGMYVQDIAGSGIDENESMKVETYISTSTSPTATIRQPKTVIKSSYTPAIGDFSSRGPNLVSPYILKPDLAAPGVGILAAWTEFLEPITKFKIISGTSMACPHVSGASALIKSLHPDWSPAAIKSALMTTATVGTGGIFGFGAGEINIGKAVDPGLVYDLNESDYKEFLCGGNFTANQFLTITGEDISTCPTPVLSPWNLNYPTITVGDEVDTIVTRTVTNVGDAVSTYSVEVSTIPGTTVTVEPTELSFTEVGEKKSFTVSVNIVDPTVLPSAGILRWSDGVRAVDSVIFISTYTHIQVV